MSVMDPAMIAALVDSEYTVGAVISCRLLQDNLNATYAVNSRDGFVPAIYERNQSLVDRVVEVHSDDAVAEMAIQPPQAIFVVGPARVLNARPSPPATAAVSVIRKKPKPKYGLKEPTLSARMNPA